jgi:hypothetical protein
MDVNVIHSGIQGSRILSRVLSKLVYFIFGYRWAGYNLTTKIITLLEFFNFVSKVSRLLYEWSSDCWCVWKSFGVNACLQWRNVFSFHWIHLRHIEAVFATVNIFRSLDRESNPRPLAYGNTASIEGTTTLTTKPNPLLQNRRFNHQGRT